MQELNEEQRAAVTSTEGFVRVVAGAGSGKTRALAHRFAFLVNEMGILPENILCVTFTNKAANEMRQRIRLLTGDNDTGFINTFHGFCVAVLQEDSHVVQYPKSFLVLDNSDIDAMLRVIYEERGLTLRDRTFSDARDMIEVCKLFKCPDYYQDLIGMSSDALYEKYQAATERDDIIFYGYLYQQKKCFGLDYNDLIKFTLYAFSQDEEVRLKWQQRLEYIMIDEFQDIDGLQYELMSVLCAYHKNLFIVGDPDQTIYTWRGADVRYLLNFDSVFQPTRTIMMLDNYRSTPQILAAANSLVAKNTMRMEKALTSRRPDGKKPVFYFGGSTEDEANWIAKQVEALHAEGVPYRDMAVLYRAHYVTRSVEEAFLAQKLPYHIYSGVPFFGRAEIKDALSYLRMVVAQDDLSFRRIVNVPKHNMGKRRMAFLEEYAAQHDCTLHEALKRTADEDVFKGTKAAQFIRLIDAYAADYEHRAVSDVLSSILDESGYETMLRTEGSQERLDNLAELKQSIHEYETTCGEEATASFYLAHVALFSNADVEEAQDKVKLMTIHAAKGLEFPYVFLCGMNEGVLPSARTKDLAGMEEERRLAFVALTRAEQGLYLSGAEGFSFGGAPRYPSRFVLDIDEDLIDFARKPNAALVDGARAQIERSKKYMPERAEANAFSVGTRVRHAYLGEGVIEGVDEGKGAYVVRFESLPTPRKISYRGKAVPLTALD